MVMEKVTNFLAEHLSVDTSEIKAETTFESLGIDSLDTVEMVMALEDDLGIELELNESVLTVGELVAFVESKLSEKA